MPPEPVYSQFPSPLIDFRNAARQDVDDTFLAFHIVVPSFARCASIPGQLTLSHANSVEPHKSFTTFVRHVSSFDLLEYFLAYSRPPWTTVF